MTRHLLVLALALLASPLAAATFLVTSTADSGPGTLRQGIVDANAGACAFPCTIDFGLEAEGFETRRIALESPLPGIVANRVSIAADARRLGDIYIGKRLVEVIGSSAWRGDGLRIEGAKNVRIAGISFIGFNGHGVVADHADGLSMQVSGVDGNARNGVLLVGTIGALVRGTLIAANGHSGIYAVQSAALELTGNAIGTDSWNTDPGRIAGNNLNGIHLHDTRDCWVAVNYIRNNGGDAIRVTGHSVMNDLEFNSFRDNRGRDIEIGGEGAGDPLAPVVESAEINRGHVRIRGFVKTEPNTRVRIQYYQHGELLPAYFGNEFESDANGIARFEVYLEIWGFERGPVRAIATHLFNQHADPGQTSEFGAVVEMVEVDVTVHATSHADSGPGSLREAIELMNADEDCRQNWPCAIAIDGVGVIRPLTELPAITRSAVWLDGGVGGNRTEIDGSLCAGCNGLVLRADRGNADLIVVRNLDIHGFARHGILTDRSENARVYALISDCTIRENGGSGIHVESGSVGVGLVFDNRISINPLGGCVIGGNGSHGISIGATAWVRANGNFIGTDATSVQPFGNRGSGIHSAGAGEFTHNVIAFNHQHGVSIEDPTKTNSVSGGQIHSNGGLGIHADAAIPQRAPVILSARVEGEETRVTYQFDSPELPVPMRYVIAWYASSFADASGQGEGRMAVAGEFVSGPGTREITLSRNLAGKFLSATAHVFDAFAYIPAGTTSAFSAAVQVTSGSCPTTAPSNVIVNGNAFRWDPVPGASEYRIWTMKRGDMPRIAWSGTEPQATLQLPPGEYEWVVEARFGAACYGTQSNHGMLVLAP
jgi:hypothetical protein